MMDCVQLEQLNEQQLDILNQTICDVLDSYYTIEKVYVVGSFVFGLDKVNDIDIVVTIPETESFIRDDTPTGDSVYYDFSLFSKLVSRQLGVNVELIPKNGNVWRSSSIHVQIAPPIYNLTDREWINKQPGDKWNYYIMRLDDKAWKVDRDSDEGRQLAIQHGKV